MCAGVLGGHTVKRVDVCAGTCADVWAYVCADTAWILSAWYVCMHVYMFMYNA